MNFDDIEPIRHVFARDGAPPLELTPGVELFLGRSKECDIQISSRKASRRHARISWDNDAAIIHDLESNNGTFVNDKQVRFKKLSDGDEVRVATFLGIYRQIRDYSELTLDTALTAMSTANDQQPNRSGHLDKTPLLKVLTQLSRDHFSGQVSLLPKLGRIGLRNGEPVWAVSKDKSGKELLGEDALLTMLVIDKGMFYASTRQIDEVEDNIHQNLAQILAGAIKRGTRRIDRSVLTDSTHTPPRTKAVSPPPRPSDLLRRRARPGVARAESIVENQSQGREHDETVTELESDSEQPKREKRPSDTNIPRRAPRRTARWRRVENAARKNAKGRRSSSKFIRTSADAGE